MKIQIKADTSQLKRQVEKANRNIEKNLPVIVGKGASSYADNAQKFVPPRFGNWSKSIPAKAYKREIIDLLDIVRSRKAKRNMKKYGAMLHKGYRFAIKGRQNFKPKTFFFRTKSLARKFSRIINRGLLKVMFGANLLKYNEIPKSIAKLLEKAPNLKRLVFRLNPVSRQDKKNQSSMTVSNQSGNITQALTNRAVREGKYHARKQIKRQAVIVVQNTIREWR